MPSLTETRHCDLDLVPERLFQLHAGNSPRAIVGDTLNHRPDVAATMAPPAGRNRAQLLRHSLVDAGGVDRLGRATVPTATLCRRADIIPVLPPRFNRICGEHTGIARSAIKQ